MDEKERIISGVYSQYKISSNQFFVELQKLYNLIARLYWKEDIKQFEDERGYIKEYSALNEMFDSIQLPVIHWRAFRCMWKHANKVKHSDEIIEFNDDYALLCSETYNNIVIEVFAEDAKSYQLDNTKFTSGDEIEGYCESVASAFKHALKLSEERCLEDLLKKRTFKFCKKCNAPMVLKSRIADGAKFWGCSNYNKTGCRYTIDYTFDEYLDDILSRTNRRKAKHIFAQSQLECANDIPIKYWHGSQWFISRERIKGGKVHFVQSLGLPYCLLKDICKKEDQINDYKRCSHWRFDYNQQTYHKVNTEIKSISGLAYKLLTRGKLTLVSPKVEEYINSTFGSNREISDALINYVNSHDAPQFFLDGHGTEKIFYNKVLPFILGENFERYIIPQADLASLIATNEDIGQQRVDFAINDGRNRVVIELDDISHEDHMDYDSARDKLLEDSGFKVYRIQNKDVNLDSIAIRALASNIARLNLSKEQLYSSRGLIAGKIIHQLEIIVAYGLMHGIYNNEQCIKVDLDTSIFSENEIKSILAIATGDINEYLSRIALLYSIKLDFRILFVSSKAFSNEQKEISYNTQKNPTVDRIIVNDFAYASDFINNMPIYNDLGNYSSDEETVLYFMHYFFRKDGFREGQFEAISNTLAKKDSVILLPTGSGKSIAFQLASLLTRGSTFVISPLVALMNDQVDNLKQYGIDRARALTGALSNEEKEEMTDLIISGDSIITYISPERLQIESFRRTIQDTLREIPIPLFVIDEAHCLSEWGHDFRTSYLNLGRIIRDYCLYDGKAPTIMALTGTASDNVLTDIRNQLEIWEDGSLITPNKFDREELHYRIVPCQSIEKQKKLLETLKDIPTLLNIEGDDFFELKGDDTNSGLVFCPYVNGEYGISSIKSFLTNQGYSCGIYGGKRPKGWSGDLSWNKQKAQNASDFKNNKCNMLVATKAYGMGIDKQNIRYIIHYNLAQSIEAYYQETGRAGRDKADSVCILLSSLNDDYDRIDYFHNKAFKGPNVELNYIKSIVEVVDFSEQSVVNLTAKANNEDDRISYEKAIYRLLLIGVIEDYTKIRQDEYRLIIQNVTTDKIRQAYLKCIEKYHEGRVLSEDKKLIELQTDNLTSYIIEVSKLLISFLYDNIEASRRAAMDAMRDLAKAAALKDNQNQFIHSEIESYLSSDNKEAIGIITNGDRAGLKEAAEFYINGDYHSLNSIRAQITRQIESHPDHPGLLLSRAYIDLQNNELMELDEVLEDINSAVWYAKTRYSATPEDLKTYFGWMIADISKKNKNFALKICSNLDDIYSSKELLDIVMEITEEEELIMQFAYSYFADCSDDILKILGGKK